MIIVRLKPGERADVAMRRLRKICEKEGIMKECKKHQFYEKPSDKRRRELRKSKKKSQEESSDYVPTAQKKEKVKRPSPSY